MSVRCLILIWWLFRSWLTATGPLPPPGPSRTPHEDRCSCGAPTRQRAKGVRWCFRCEHNCVTSDGVNGDTHQQEA